MRYDTWTPDTEFKTPAFTYLHELAQAVISAEVKEADMRMLAPWDKTYSKKTERARGRFESERSSLVALVPDLPRRHSAYYQN
jgi:hypothetical protein